jgi:CIC family chloride channel protein
MAGILSGLYHAPMTAIFLIAEITGGYTLMIPLMIVSSISFAISRYFDPYSMDMKDIAESGNALTSDRDKNVLSAINTADYIENDYPLLSPTTSLGDLVKVVSNSTRNVFPVVDSQKRLLGLIWLDDIRDTMFKTEFYTSVIAQDLMVKPRELVMHSDPMDIVMQKFDNTGNWVLPVVDEGIYEGFISKSNVFSGYREKLKVSTIE